MYQRLAALSERGDLTINTLAVSFRLEGKPSKIHLIACCTRSTADVLWQVANAVLF